MGITYDNGGDLYLCLRNNSPLGITTDDVKSVLAVIEGDSEGPPWHWLVELEGGIFAYITGWCDYTGWDCQSNADATKSIYVYGAMRDVEPEVFEELSKQLSNGRVATKRDLVYEKLLAGVD